MPTKAAQYVRMSTDQQLLSLDTQKQAIQAYAEANGIEIVETYEDQAKSGLTLQNRTGMQRLLRDVMEPSCPYRKILVLDVTRWGRFQNVDESAYYEYHCRKHGVEVTYVAEAFPEHASPLDAVIKHLKRVMAAEYSRELSIKIRAGQERSVSLGFKGGGPSYLGFARQAVAADGTPKGLLKKGERKPLLTDHVRLVPGPPEEIALVRRIFQTFTRTALTTIEIADLLNSEGLKTREGGSFNKFLLERLLRTELCLGTYVFGTSRWRTGRRMLTPSQEPMRMAGRLEPIIDEETWLQARWKLDHPVRRKLQRKPKYSHDAVMASLRDAMKSQPHIVQSSLHEFGLPGPQVFRRLFGGYSAACEAVGLEWDSNAGPWFEHRVSGHRLVRRLYRDVLALLESHGLKCSGDYVKCTLYIGGTHVKVKTAWPINLPTGTAWRFNGDNWREGWLLLMRVNEDGTGKDFFLMPPDLRGQVPRQIPPAGLPQFEDHRIEDARTLATRLLWLTARGFDISKNLDRS